jgi:GNAT superfamily N-acetyltransferase
VIRIRRATDADRPAIAAIHAQSWRDAYRGVLPEAFLDAEVDEVMRRRWQEQAIRPEDAVLVAAQGIGRRLLAETARHFLGLGRGRGHLHVVAANLRARALYLALGGEPAGIEDKNLYGTLVPNERIEWPDLAVLLERAEIG